MADVIIVPTRNGPYHVKGVVTIKTEDGRVVEQVVEETWLCRCGHSQSKPFCDGSHERVGFVSDLDAELAAKEATGSPADQTDFQDVGAVDDLGEGEIKGVRIDGTPVVLGRINGQIYAIGGVCTHQLALLEEGELDGTTVVCPLHDSGFDLRTGQAVRPPAVTPVPTYEVKIENGRILVARAPRSASAAR